MPLDKAKARSRVEGARNAYRIGIRADFIQLLADDLEGALNQIDQDALALGRAQNDVARFQRELDEEKTAYRKLREQSSHTETCVALLREIAKSPKGAAAKASAQLKAMGVTEVAPAAPVAVPAKVVVP